MSAHFGRLRLYRHYISQDLIGDRLIYRTMSQLKVLTRALAVVLVHRLHTWTEGTTNVSS